MENIKIQKLTRSGSFFLEESIAIWNQQVSSMLLFRSETARITLVSMGKGEEISAETMPSPRTFLLIQGQIQIREKKDFALQAKESLSLGENSFYSIEAKEKSIFLEIEYQTGGKDMGSNIKHIKEGKVLLLKEEISYEKGQVTSKNLVLNPSMVMSLMAFDKGESLAPHTAPGDALVTVLEGEGHFSIDGIEHSVKTGQSILLPAHILHAVEAKEAFKMLLIIAK